MLQHPQTHGLVLRGWLLAQEERPEEGASLVRQGIAALDALGAVFHRSHHLGLLAGIHARLGDPCCNPAAHPAASPAVRRAWSG
jgi:hypothetical protein